MVWLFAGMLYAALNMIMEAVRGAGGGVQEICLQDFKSNLLAKGLVARSEVINGTHQHHGQLQRQGLFSLHEYGVIADAVVRRHGVC
jgi:hypothetical protein